MKEFAKDWILAFKPHRSERGWMVRVPALGMYIHMGMLAAAWLHGKGEHHARNTAIMLLSIVAVTPLQRIQSERLANFLYVTEGLWMIFLNQSVSSQPALIKGLASLLPLKTQVFASAFLEAFVKRNIVEYCMGLPTRNNVTGGDDSASTSDSDSYEEGDQKDHTVNYTDIQFYHEYIKIVLSSLVSALYKTYIPYFNQATLVSKISNIILEQCVDYGMGYCVERAVGLKSEQNFTHDVLCHLPALTLITMMKHEGQRYYPDNLSQHIIVSGLETVLTWVTFSCQSLCGSRDR